MDDAKQSFFSRMRRSNKQKKHRHPQLDNRSVAADLPLSATRPYISLKARMLGGQAETIMRLGGTTR
jgi:hypothetical protein